MATAALVLAGGGLKCAAQVWWCEELIPALIRKHIDVKVLAGSSGGGINAAKLAEGETDDELLQALEDLASIWLAIDKIGSEVIFPINVLTPVTHAFSSAFLDGTTLWGLVDGSLFRHRPLDAAKIARSVRELDIFVRNKITRKQEIISNRDQAAQQDPSLLLKAVVASASRHPFFPQVTINGVPYGDGEAISLSKIFQADCDFIFILLPYKKNHVETPGDDWFSKHFKISVEAFITIIMQIQEAEQKEIERAVERANDVKTLEALCREEQTRCWRSSGKRAVEERFRAAGFTFRGNRAPRIIPVYLEYQPLKLRTHHSERGDLLRLREPCRVQMRDVLAGLGLY